MVRVSRDWMYSVLLTHCRAPALLSLLTNELDVDNFIVFNYVSKIQFTSSPYFFKLSDTAQITHSNTHMLHMIVIKCNLV
jgi:hypothetical protein